MRTRFEQIVTRVVVLGTLGAAAACARAPESAGSRIAASSPNACAALLGAERPSVEILAAAPMETRVVGSTPPGVVAQPLRVPHCKVDGTIDGSIHFELLLPSAWNGKLVMGGGGGYVGSVQNQAQDGGSAGPTPLERGYATVGTDTGHSASGLDASWALNNREAQENFAHRAVHRTAEVAKAIIGRVLRPRHRPLVLHGLLARRRPGDDRGAALSRRLRRHRGRGAGDRLGRHDGGLPAERAGRVPRPRRSHEPGDHRRQSQAACDGAARDAAMRRTVWPTAS